MFPRTNIEERLIKTRNNRITADEILSEVHEILKENERKRTEIRKNLETSTPVDFNYFDEQLLDGGRIYHLTDIKKICVDYRLRFLNSTYFKGDFPEEAISEIRNLEEKHNTQLSGFRIVAPSKLLKLENADDPLLFAPIGKDYYYLIHKWGNDLHPFRRLLMWPFKNIENLVVFLVAFSMLLTFIFPIHWLTPNPGNGEYIFLFLYIFKAVVGLTVLYGGAKGKFFNNQIWNSKYYNG